MTRLRQIESKLTLPLETSGWSIVEGIDESIELSIGMAWSCRDALCEFVLNRRRRALSEMVIYTASKSESLGMLAMFRRQSNPGKTADYYFNFHVFEPRSIEPCDLRITFEAIHDDFVNGLQPPTRRCKGDTWTIAPQDDPRRYGWLMSAGYGPASNLPTSGQTLLYRRDIPVDGRDVAQ